MRPGGWKGYARDPISSLSHPLLSAATSLSAALESVMAGYSCDRFCCVGLLIQEIVADVANGRTRRRRLVFYRAQQAEKSVAG